MHKFGYIPGKLNLNKEMNVIGHNAIKIKHNFEFAFSPFEYVYVFFIILLTTKGGLFPISPDP